MMKCKAVCSLPGHRRSREKKTKRKLIFIFLSATSEFYFVNIAAHCVCFIFCYGCEIQNVSVEKREDMTSILRTAIDWMTVTVRNIVVTCCWFVTITFVAPKWNKKRISIAIVFVSSANTTGCGTLVSPDALLLVDDEKKNIWNSIWKTLPSAPLAHTNPF